MCLKDIKQFANN